MLLGYKLEFLPNGRVKLTSVYSTSNDHCFHFSSENESSGADEKEGIVTMQLVGGGNDHFVASLDDKIRHWVVEKGSIPCFLSSFTMEEWNNKYGYD